MDNPNMSTEDGGYDSRPFAKKAKRNPYRQNSSESVARPKRADEFAATGTQPDYKNVDQLRRYVNTQGKIQPRRRSGLSAKNQRLVARAIKRARHLAMLPMPGTMGK